MRKWIVRAGLVVLIIGKYLSSLRKLDHVVASKEGLETQL
jgi:hypothetical protein